MRTEKLLGILICTIAVSACGQKAGTSKPAPRRKVEAKTAANEKKPADWGPAGKQIQCRLECSEEKIGDQEEGELTLWVRNITPAVARYHISNCCGPTFKVIARWEDGKSLDFFDAEQQEHDPCGQVDWLTLKPGETRKHVMRFARGAFSREEGLFVGRECVGILNQYGRLSMTIRVGDDAETNPVVVDVPKQ